MPEFNAQEQSKLAAGLHPMPGEAHQEAAPAQLAEPDLSDHLAHPAAVPGTQQPEIMPERPQPQIPSEH